MKSYLVDEIGKEDVKRIHQFLREKALSSGLDSLFWVKVANPLLSPIQQSHLPCHPHVFAIETGQTFLKAELYLRTLRDMRCPCQDYCTPAQAHFVIEWINEMLEELSIRT
jgi:hypothetical protein